MKEDLVEILEELEHCTSKDGKIKILMNNKQNDQIKTLFYYVFSEKMKFGININDFTYINGDSEFKCIFDLLDNLLMTNIKVDDSDEYWRQNAINEMNKYIYNAKENEKYWIIKVILQDLDLDITIDMLKQVWNNFMGE